MGCVDSPELRTTDDELSGVAVLDFWGNRFTTYGTTVRENALRTQIRTTIVQLAMFDAVNAAVDGGYRGYASNPTAAAGASPEAAATRAAYIVALTEFPSITATITADYNAQIATVPGTPQQKADGIVVGEAAANAVLAKRVGDNRNLPDLTGYVPGSGPGVWIPTPPAFAAPQTPFLRYVRPFGYDDPTRFRPKAPPELDSKTYTADYIEIKDVGSATNTSRTAAQTATALFWSPSATALWTANVRSLAQGHDILTAARFEAIGISAVTNGLLASWEAKFEYMFWRPITAIRAGGTDGNPDTIADPAWNPLISTPTHPEYVAAHTTVGSATMGFYTVYFDTDELSFDFKGNLGATRHYNNVREAEAEEGNARVWGGMHWRNSTEVGSKVGRRVGKYTATHMLKALDDEDSLAAD